jgi:hypothetical protein
LDLGPPRGTVAVPVSVPVAERQWARGIVPLETEPETRAEADAGPAAHRSFDLCPLLQTHDPAVLAGLLRAAVAPGDGFQTGVGEECGI